MKEFFTSLILIFFCLTSYSFDAKTIKGRVIDEKTGSAIPVANVYINGTTYGTTSDTSGYFKLDVSLFPCEIVVSYIGYSAERILVYSPIDTLQFKLKPEPYLMNEVVVSDVSNREAHLYLFNEWFLGKDKWGKKATILNDSVLFFIKSKNSFKAYATAPIHVHLPLLGYDVFVDMKSFNLGRNKSYGSEQCFLSAYYRFKEHSNLSNYKRRQVKKRREKAYYCSTQHFLRSLYKRELRQNGYQVYYKHVATERYHTKQLKTQKNSNNKGFRLENIDKTSDEYVDQPKDLKVSYIKDKHGNKYGVLKGYKGDILKIVYRQRNGRPINLNLIRNLPKICYRSSLYFQNDVCTFRENGTIFDNSILFDGTLSAKKVGAILPDNYNPDFM